MAHALLVIDDQRRRMGPGRFGSGRQGVGGIGHGRQTAGSAWAAAL
ncbi:hypothetical protein X805_15620 [Sphaerotilus natans subsp. natans DSM 6575]|uniref:Uncharacterized protein n=1 Tax=Sphaerotilus natans subsp. natans DSM 6575 TaxID=1286631 RepID=A0A059KNX3_9BURK|nr:hypothetical protein X805_15620 [Sphaerotilus natans subsp. natans DSM 6575]